MNEVLRIKRTRVSKHGDSNLLTDFEQRFVVFCLLRLVNDLYGHIVREFEKLEKKTRNNSIA